VKLILDEAGPRLVIHRETAKALLGGVVYWNREGMVRRIPDAILRNSVRESENAARLQDGNAEYVAVSWDQTT
jgi:hypothetical protein